MLKPTGDRVFIIPLKKEEKKVGSIILPSAYQQSEETMGTVAAVGEGPRTVKGVLLPHVVSVGDVVIFTPQSGQEMDLDGVRVLVMREEEILGIVEMEKE